jgi:hypothetical protein
MLCSWGAYLIVGKPLALVKQLSNVVRHTVGVPFTVCKTRFKRPRFGKSRSFLSRGSGVYQKHTSQVNQM